MKKIFAVLFLVFFSHSLFAQLILADTTKMTVFDPTKSWTPTLKKLDEYISKVGTAAPTFTLASGFGSGATSSIVGTNIAGEITVNVGSGTISCTDWGTINFSSNFDDTNYALLLYPANQNANLSILYIGYAKTKNVGSVVFGDANSMSARIFANTTYKIYYNIVRY